VIGFMLHGLMGSRECCASLTHFQIQKISLNKLKRYIKIRTIEIKTNILKDFSNAIRPVSFFVHLQIFRHENAERQDISLDNGRTNERLVIKTIDRYSLVVLISRYSVGANQQEWIEANEREIMEWDFHEQNRRIRFDYSLGENGDNV
jgi:hypothetical protein